MDGILLLVLALSALAAFQLGRRRALSLAGGVERTLHSRASYHGAYVAMWCAIPALAFLFLGSIFQGSVVNWLVTNSAPAEIQALDPNRLGLFLNDARNLAAGGATSGEVDDALAWAAGRFNDLESIARGGIAALVLVLMLAGLSFGYSRLSIELRARHRVESLVRGVLAACAALAILVTAGIVLSLVFEAARFFALVPVTDFLFGLEWSPQTALRSDQVGSSGAFGAVPVFAGTLLITLIAMAVAVPIGLMAAIYLAEYAARRTRAVIKPLLEILAGIPTVVYGFFAALTIAPLVRGAGESLGLGVASESALAAGLVMGVMIIPFVSSLSDDVITAVPQSLREASLGVGATPSETIRQVVLPAALPGVVGAVLLAISRAIGETMIVVMAAGLAANLTANPLEAVTTVTVQVVTLLVGDQEFDSAKTLAAFALGLVLFLVTLSLNVVALRVVRKYREQYD